MSNNETERLQTKIAFLETLKIWKQNTEATKLQDFIRSDPDIPLCNRFIHEPFLNGKNGSCDGCPVRIATGASFCGNTNFPSLLAKMNLEQKGILLFPTHPVRVFTEAYFQDLLQIFKETYNLPPILDNSTESDDNESA